MKTKKTHLWTKAPVANLVRYEATGIYFVRAKVRGKPIRKSLETNVLSVAKQRLADVLGAEHKAVAPSATKVVGKMTFGDALAIFKERQTQSTELKPGTKYYNSEITLALLRTWPELEQMDVKRITKHECLCWRAAFAQKYAATRVNGALSVLRRVLDIAVDAGVRYDNPAKDKDVKRARVRRKELKLPEPDQFIALVKEIREAGSGFSKHCGDAIEFFAYAGPRLTEAAHIYGRDCCFSKNEIVIRGDPKTGTKNWEMRRVPIIPEMRVLLERLKAKRGEQEFLDHPVLQVRKFNRSLTGACKKLGLHHLTHHDLRHLFATRCIESGVDIPTVAKWLGHKDGGVLAMQTYGHLRDKHSSDMAQKVVFSEKIVQAPINLVQLPTQTEERENVDGCEDQKKAGARAKAKYRYPWWASSNPVEVFWGQVHEEVAIIPSETFQRCTAAAMNREVFLSELEDKESLALEFRARMDEITTANLTARILGVVEKVA